ncbi:MAG: ABC transporter substrate-binding protein [Aliarcobacter sp.]
MKYFLLIFYGFILNLYSNNLDDSKLENIKLQLQWKHQFEFAGFYAAKEKGFYKDVGLDVEFIEFDSKKNIVNEVVNKNADYGLTYSSFIVDYMNGKPLVFVANFFKQSPLVLVTQKDIYTPADLRNKKIMGLLDSSHEQIVLTMLDKFNITKNDFQNIPRKSAVESFINKKIDALTVFTTNEIYTLDKLGIKYNILDPAAFGTKFYDLNLFTTKSELMNNPSRVENFKQASIKGWEYALKNKNEIVDIILKKYNTQNKSKEALLFEANQIEYLMLSNIYPIGSVDLERVQNISDSFAQTLFMPRESKEKLESFIHKKESNSIELTINQKEYLKNKKVIKFCVDPNWLPLEKIENGKHIGISSEFLNLIKERIGIPFYLIETNNWTESLEKIKKRECDILALAEQTPLRKEYLNFTTPYIRVPLVIATKSGLPFINDLNEIKEKTLGVVKNYSLVELLKNKYPNIKVLEIDSIEEGLKLVSQEKIFGFLDNSMSINHEIQKNKIIDISITGQFSEYFSLSIASRNDENILNEILEKTLLSIDDRSKTTFIEKWNNIKYELKTDYRLIYQTVFFGIVLISVFIYWNFKLTQEIKKKEIIQKKLKESEEKFRTLFDIAPVLLDAFDKNGKVVLWNKECEKVFGYSLEEIKKEENPLSLFYPDPLIQREVFDDFNCKDENIYKEWTPLTKDGRKLIIKWANIKLPNNEILHIGFDITQERTNEILLYQSKQELEKLNNSLEEKIKDEIQKNTKQQLLLMQQSKLAQMGEMIENIAHQWRQPLAQVNSSVLLIDVELKKNRFQNEIIENKLIEIESLTSYMSKTIDDFKNFFDPNKKKSIFKVEESIIKARNILKGRIKESHINLIINIEEELKIYSYLEELQQVILIILNNAIDAIILNKVLNPKILIDAYSKDSEIMIFIEDNALGIESEIIDKIFEPYFTTKQKSRGTGLGLYISKMIIEDGLNGSLDVENKKNGACFKIKIPKGEYDE